jgi:cytochrome oxidase Cu insertion factor (SCO1/SenC/PrrC family)
MKCHWTVETLGDLQSTSRDLDPGVRIVKLVYDTNFDEPDAYFDKF